MSWIRLAFVTKNARRATWRRHDVAMKIADVR
jgi:hypothetical protein